MSTIPIHRLQFHTLIFNGSPDPYKSSRFSASWTMAMDSKFSSTINSNSNMKKKEELSVQLSKPSIPKVETLSSNDLQFDRLQPSDHELVRENRFEFGQFVAREAVLDEEYWTAAWLRAESHWENRTYERYVDNYKRKFTEQEFTAVKRRCKVQSGDSCTCFITERVKAPIFCSINRTPPSRYGYIANLCVAKSARRQGIASNMMYFAVEYAKSNGVTQVYVHVDRNNRPAQLLYQKMGFEMVETANSRLLLEDTYLLRLQA